MAEMRCPNCGRKLERQSAAGKTIRCPKCGENLRYLARNEPSQGWEKLAKLLEGGGLNPLGSSPAALPATLHRLAVIAPAPSEDRGEVDAAAAPAQAVEGVGNGDAGRQEPGEDAILREVRAIGEDIKGVKGDLERIETRLAALEALLAKR